MAKKPKPEPDDKKQSQRFVETAKLLGVDEDGKAFNRAMGALVPVRRKSVRKKDSG